MHVLVQRSRLPASKSPLLSAGLRKQLVWILRFLAESLPRRIDCISYEAPTILFTDGACEGDSFSVVTVGAVLCSPRRPALLTFGLTAPPHVADAWKTVSTQTQVIGQAEIVPLMLAKLTFKSYLDNAQMIAFVDNDSARQALIKGVFTIPSISTSAK